MQYNDNTPASQSFKKRKCAVKTTGLPDDDDSFLDPLPRITRIMLKELCSWIDTKDTDEEKRKWMHLLFELNESHTGCIDVDKHWYYQNEQPEIFDSYLECVKTCDLKAFQELPCFSD
jgi:hypothetical protein